MAYVMDEYERRKKMQEQYRQAVERRLTTDTNKQRGKKPTDPTVLEALRRRKETGYFGGM